MSDFPVVERLRKGDTSLKETLFPAAESIEQLAMALDGCLHFSDAFISNSVLGKALLEWRQEARAALAKARGE